MRQSEFDNPDIITKRIREIRQEENRVPKPTANDRRGTIAVMPFCEAPVGKVGLIRLETQGGHLLRLGSRCKICPVPGALCRCYIAGKPVDWCDLPEGWL